MKSKKLRVSLAVAALLIFSFVVFTGVRAASFKKTQDASALSAEEAFELTQFLLSEYPEEYQTLKKLPYNITQPNLDVWAKAAILVDVSNGSVLYQKN